MTVQPFPEIPEYFGLCFKQGNDFDFDFSTIFSTDKILSDLSMFLGNLFVYFQFQGKTHIDLGTRQLVFGVLIAVAVIGIIFLATLRQSKEGNSIENIDKNDSNDSQQDGITDAFKKAIKLFFTPRMLLLSMTFIYTGKASNRFTKLTINQ